MSKDTNAKKKPTREEKKKQMVRVLALIMAALMILGVAYMALSMLVQNASAAAPNGERYAISDEIDTSSLKFSGDVLIKVGLLYGSDLPAAFETTSTDGFVLGIQSLDGEKEFEALWELGETALLCTIDVNLTGEDGSYTPAGRERDTDLGAYHLEAELGRCDSEELAELIDGNERTLRRLGLELIPCWIGGAYRLRIGSFSSKAEAEERRDDVEEVFDDYRITVAEPSRTAVSVVSPEEGRIVFEFDGEGACELGMTAQKDVHGNTYLRTPAGNVYDGVFCFVRRHYGSADGLSLINILPLEAYVAGVLPYEITNTWPIETLRAFAIVVRSFTLKYLDKHGSDGFDLCSDVCCQVYRGAGDINNQVMKAVHDSEGLVMTYEGEIVNAYYSSSVGGVTVSALDAWGYENHDNACMQAVDTPWENYMDYASGFWITEVSPEDLCARLNQAGYRKLSGAIASIEIVELAKNSTYIKELLVTDIYGESETIRYCDNVRLAFTPYVKSANFVVGKGSVAYTVPTGTVSENPTVSESPAQSTVPESPADTPVIEASSEETVNFLVRTADRTVEVNDSEPVVITGNGTVHMSGRIQVMTAKDAVELRGEKKTAESAKMEPPAVTEKKTPAPTVSVKADGQTKIATAENRENFIFVGKGWGHGVGMSQYGALDLANLGYTAEEILDAYYDDIKIVDYMRSADYR